MPSFNQSTKSDYKQSARAATTADIVLSGLQTIDGVALAANERVLVKHQTAPAENGVYTAQVSGWSRAADADGNTEVSAGLMVFVSEGATHGDQLWILTTDDPIVLGTTALTFDNVEDIVTGGLGGSFVTLGTAQTITGAKTLEGALAATDVLSTFVTGDAGPRLVVNADGGLEWHDGAGGGIQASIQQLGGNLVSLVGGYRGASDVMARNGAADQVRMGATGAGAGFRFGSTEDTNLYRSAADTLKTDDSLIVDLDLTVNGNSAIGSAPADSVGFYGAAPVTQQATPVTLGDVINTLQNLGLTA